MEENKKVISHKKGHDKSSPWRYILINENNQAETESKGFELKPVYIRCEGGSTSGSHTS